MRKCVLCFLAAALLAAYASAQPSRNAGYGGDWAIETDQSRHGCVIAGQAHLAAKPNQRDRYDVRLTTHERCTNGDEWRSQQHCEAIATGQALQVTCAIVTVTPSNYAPDNFSLQRRAPALLEGVLISSWNIAARWRRSAAFVS